MELKILIFTITLNGSGLTKTIFYNDNEYIIIDKYQIDNLENKPKEKVTYYTQNSNLLIELFDGEVTLNPVEKYSLNTWEMPGFESVDWHQEVQKIDNDQVQIIKMANQLIEKDLLKKIEINPQISKSIPMILEYEGMVYLKILSSVSFNDRDIYRAELSEERKATKAEKQIFNDYKEFLKR